METGSPVAPLDIDSRYTPLSTFDSWLTMIGPRRSPDLSLKEMDASRVDHSIRFLMRAAAMDTGAIELLYGTDRGLTMTVAGEAPGWEGALAEKSGSEAIRFFEAQLKGYEIVKEVAECESPVTETSIRQLHEQVCASQETYVVQTAAGPQRQALLRGAYKRLPNHVIEASGSWFAFAPVADTVPEMARLVAEMNSPMFRKASAVLQAAYAHYGLVRVHPFSDGNGRVARLLASIFLFREFKTPLLIFSDERNEYLEALKAADEGDAEAFVAFLEERAEAAVQLCLLHLKFPNTPAAPSTLKQLSSLYRTQVGYSHGEVDEAADALLRLAHDEFASHLKALPRPRELDAALQWGTANYVAPDGWRVPIAPAPRALYVVLRSAAPAHATVSGAFFVIISRDGYRLSLAPVAPSPFVGLEMETKNVYRQGGMSSADLTRIRLWVQKTVELALVQLQEKAAEALRKSGN